MRRKRIGDAEWATYAETDRVPIINEKCFCLEPKTRKWLRARIHSYEPDKMLAQVRFMDTGHLSTNHTLDTLIAWRNFDLSKMPARSIRCVFANDDGETGCEKDICLETKFFFKDLTANVSLKCIIVEPMKQPDVGPPLSLSQVGDVYNDTNDEQIWIVRLYNQKDYKKLLDQNNNASVQSLNELVIEFNSKEKNTKSRNILSNEMRCIDIRLAAGNIETGTVMLKTGLELEESVDVAKETCSLGKSQAFWLDIFNKKLNFVKKLHCIYWPIIVKIIAKND